MKTKLYHLFSIMLVLSTTTIFANPKDRFISETCLAGDPLCVEKVMTQQTAAAKAVPSTNKSEGKTQTSKQKNAPTELKAPELVDNAKIEKSEEKEIVFTDEDKIIESPVVPDNSLRPLKLKKKTIMNVELECQLDKEVTDQYGFDRSLCKKPKAALEKVAKKQNKKSLKLDVGASVQRTKGPQVISPDQVILAAKIDNKKLSLIPTQDGFDGLIHKRPFNLDLSSEVAIGFDKERITSTLFKSPTIGLYELAVERDHTLVKVGVLEGGFIHENNKITGLNLNSATVKFASFDIKQKLSKNFYVCVGGAWRGMISPDITVKGQSYSDTPLDNNNSVYGCIGVQGNDLDLNLRHTETNLGKNIRRSSTALTIDLSKFSRLKVFGSYTNEDYIIDDARGLNEKPNSTYKVVQFGVSGTFGSKQ